MEQLNETLNLRESEFGTQTGVQSATLSKKLLTNRQWNVIEESEISYDELGKSSPGKRSKTIQQQQVKEVDESQGHECDSSFVHTPGHKGSGDIGIQSRAIQLTVPTSVQDEELEIKQGTKSTQSLPKNLDQSFH